MHGQRRDRKQAADSLESRILRRERLFASQGLLNQCRRRREYVIAGTDRRFLDVLNRALALLDGDDNSTLGVALHRFGNLHAHLVIGTGRFRRFVSDPGLGAGSPGQHQGDGRADAGDSSKIHGHERFSERCFRCLEC